MTIPEFFKLCADHDWSYGFSSDRYVYAKGCEESDRIVIAKKDNPVLQRIYNAWEYYSRYAAGGDRPELSTYLETQPAPTEEQHKDNTTMTKDALTQPFTPTVGGQADVLHGPSGKWTTVDVTAVSGDFATCRLPGTKRGASYPMAAVFPAGSKTASSTATPTAPTVGGKVYYFDTTVDLWLECTVVSHDSTSIETTTCTINTGIDKYSLTRPDGDVYLEESVQVTPEGKLVGTPTLAPKPEPVVVEAIVVEPPKKRSAAPKVEAKNEVAAPSPANHEVAVPGTNTNWFSGAGFNPATLVERPRLIVGQQCKQHEALGLRKGDLGLNELQLAPIAYTGPNGMPKVGDKCKWPVNFIVLYARGGQYEDIPDTEYKANPDIRPGRAYTAQELAKLREETKFTLIPFADLYVLVEKPEQITCDDNMFPHTIAGRRYASAMFSVKKGQLYKVMGAVSTIADNNPGKLAFYRFGLQTVLKDGQSVFTSVEVSRLGFLPEADRGPLAKLQAELADSLRDLESKVDAAEAPVTD